MAKKFMAIIDSLRDAKDIKKKEIADWNSQVEKKKQENKLRKVMRSIKSFNLPVRKEVAAFALLMEEVLKANDHKGDWKEASMDELLYLVDGELTEVSEAIDPYEEALSAGEDTTLVSKHLGKEAADIANYAMMIADNSGALKPYLQQLGDAKNENPELF